MKEIYYNSLHRRAYTRFSNLDTSAILVLNEKLEQPLILKDLSSRGAGVISNSPLDVNVEAKLVIKPSFFFRQAVYEKARVVWCNKVDKNLWQAGLEFAWDNNGITKALTSL